MDNLQYKFDETNSTLDLESFKPCYKWIIFNIEDKEKLIARLKGLVLNLVING